MSQKQNPSRQPQLGTYVTMIVGLLFLFLLISQAGKYHNSGYIMEKAEERLAMREEREKTLMLIGAEPQRPAGQVAQIRQVNPQPQVRSEVRPDRVPQDSGLPFNHFAQNPAPRVNPQQQAVAEKRVYRVRSNDTLYNIAAKIYGNGNRWKDIVRANPGLSDPSKLRPGMTLKIPEPDGSNAAVAAFNRWSRHNTM